MSYCVYPECRERENPETARFCQSCGASLLLQERYRVIKPLGQGGFGTTFVAVDEQLPLKPRCVVKQFSFASQDEESYEIAARLFRQEALRLNELGQHPQIPQLLAHFEEGGKLYLVQEFIEGISLDALLREEGVFNESQLRKFLTEILPVLQFIHERQIIHRDIKPANIISCRSEGENDHKRGEYILIDFGVAKLLTGTALLRTGTIIGSPEYMAPEQTRGKAIPASDLFSLGVTCIHLLTHVPPWDMYDMVNDRWSWRGFLPNGYQISMSLGRVLDKLLQGSVSQRYQFAEEVLKDLKPPEISVSQCQEAKRTVIQPSETRKKRSVLQKSQEFLSQFLRQNSPQDDQLFSDRGIDYTSLQFLLGNHQWKEADGETWKVLCEAVGKHYKSYLYPDDLTKIPCPDLETIDRLWVKYSEGHFGFSIQSQIYETVGRDYGLFCQKIGWLTYNSHNPYQGLQFRLSAPVGHLPSRVWVTGLKWWTHAEKIAEKLQECQNQSSP